jgi:thiol-disulfide isomerase/thioredoxin
MIDRLKIATVTAALAGVALLAGVVYAGGETGQPDSSSMQTGAPAPDFTGITSWINSPPLDMKQLRGKVVLVDFWTFDCINCAHTIPYVKDWYARYHDKGLVVVGVHTPEYAFEHKTENLQNAVKRFGIEYPIAQDNQYATWNAYGNQYWPAVYLFDQQGRMVYSHFGEGNYAETEKTIRGLLGLGDKRS